MTSAAAPGARRLESLDVLRGLVVAAMLMVNFSLGAEDYLHFQVPSILLHSPWAGFTVADAVFPAFLFIVGVSIAAFNRSAAAARRQVLMRTARLLLLGFLLSNVTWLWMHGWSLERGLRVMGVLQRIALCYCVATLLYRSIALRSILFWALLVLFLYWPLTLIPIPDGSSTDLTARGMNFVSWFDRVILGPHRYVEGPSGYDSEGLLSTLPAIAQCLLGVTAGRWFAARATDRAKVAAFALAGILIAGLGATWGRYFPVVKDLWTSSFVLLSTGTSMAILAVIQLLMDCGLFPRWLAQFLEVFGRNAVLAYMIYLPGLIVLALPPTPAAYRALTAPLPGAAASLVLATGFMLLMWMPLAILHRRGRHLRI
jgi:predicted acyltransferase